MSFLVMTGFARWPASLDIIASIVRAGFGLGVFQGIAGNLIVEGQRATARAPFLTPAPLDYSAACV